MTAFETVALRQFENEMIGHLKVFAAKHCEILGVEGVRKVIRRGMERAAAHGFTNRGPLRLYLEAMFMLGSDFDTDPQLPWAARILGDRKTADQMVRADRLYGCLTDYVDQVAGPDDAFAKEALRRARRVRFEDLATAGGDREKQILARFEANYPEKCRYVGEPALRTILHRGATLGREHGVSSDAGVVLMIGLMFILGHGFAADPQFPWIALTLSNGRIEDPNRRAERLYSKSMTYLDRVLAYHQQPR